MIKIDLITGFLGSGKTTFIKKYASYLLKKGERVGILENDYGAVNVDMMLLSELEGENCLIETVAGACDSDCHRRRFKTKLIALSMSGCDRVLIEPSGVFDVDEFFDSLYEPPLDRWYEIGNVIAIVDASLEEELSQNSEYLLASQIAGAGTVVLSRTQYASADEIEAVKAHLNRALEGVDCSRKLKNDELLAKDWDKLSDADFERLESCGYIPADYVKRLTSVDGAYKSIYFLNLSVTPEQLGQRAKAVLSDKSFGGVFRVKGFARSGDGWARINATKNGVEISSCAAGQEIVIVIGEQLNEEKIREHIGSGVYHPKTKELI